MDDVTRTLASILNKERACPNFRIATIEAVGCLRLMTPPSEKNREYFQAFAFETSPTTIQRAVCEQALDIRVFLQNHGAKQWDFGLRTDIRPKVVDLLGCGLSRALVTPWRADLLAELYNNLYNAVHYLSAIDLSSSVWDDFVFDNWVFKSGLHDCRFVYGASNFDTSLPKPRGLYMAVACARRKKNNSAAYAWSKALWEEYCDGDSDAVQDLEFDQCTEEDADLMADFAIAVPDAETFMARLPFLSVYQRMFLALTNPQPICSTAEIATWLLDRGAQNIVIAAEPGPELDKIHDLVWSRNVVTDNTERWLNPWPILLSSLIVRREVFLKIAYLVRRDAFRVRSRALVTFFRLDIDFQILLADRAF